MLPPPPPRDFFLNLRPEMMCSGSYFGLFFLTYSRHKKAPRIIYLYIDVEFDNKKNSALAESSLCVKHICKCRPVSVFGKLKTIVMHTVSSIH